MNNAVRIDANPSLLTKLFTLSVFFEIAKYFVLGSRVDFGITISISRVFQIIFLLFFFVSLIGNKKEDFILKIFNKGSSLFFWVFIFYLISVWLIYALLNSFPNYIGTLPGYIETLSTNTLARPSSRSLLELLIYIYYFIYFVVIPIEILKERHDFEYFFSFVIKSLIICLLIGWVDFALSIVEIETIPRHLSDGMHVGMRWHSLYGEPRDAFAILILLIGILQFKKVFFRNDGIEGALILICFVSIMMTQSLSGIGGIIFSLIMIAIFLGMKNFSFKRLFYFICMILIVFGLMYLAYLFSPRLERYVEAFSDLFEILFNSEPIFIEGFIEGQAPNILPIWYRIYEFQFTSIWPSILGSGVGSSAIVNSYYIESNELLNPHTQITRLFFEFGIVGSLFFCFAFFIPIVKTAHLVNLNENTRRGLYIIFFLVLGSFLAHRSASVYIFLGLVLSYFSNVYKIQGSK